MYCGARDCTAASASPFPLPCRFPLPVFNLPRISNYPFCPLLVLLLVLRAGAFFSLESAAEFNVPSMRASGAAKRSRPLFVQRAPIEPSSAIAQGSGTICAVGRRFQTRGDGSFRGGLRHIRALRDTSAPRPVKRRIQCKDHKDAKRRRRDFRNKNNKRFNTSKRVKPSQSGKRFSKTRLARISTAQAY